MTILVTGGAGFVGVNLVETLLDSGREVVVFDNFCRGSRNYLEALNGAGELAIQEVDLADLDSYRRALAAVTTDTDITEVWHLAANSDIPAGIADPGVDLKDTFMTSYNTLLLMREFGIKVIAFASSSAIYGNLGDQPLREDIGPLFPISNYGAMKLASEAVISAAVESYLDQAFVFRFPNVIGVPATHGVILDFVRRLREDGTRLEVLGDGSQQKSYLHVEDLISAMLYVRSNRTEKICCVNIGASDAGVSVRQIAEGVVACLSPDAQIIYGSGDRGWVGDVPKFSYSTDKLSSFGWKPKLSSVEAVQKAIQEIASQEFRS